MTVKKPYHRALNSHLVLLYVQIRRTRRRKKRRFRKAGIFKMAITNLKDLMLAQQKSSL